MLKKICLPFDEETGFLSLLLSPVEGSIKEHCYRILLYYKKDHMKVGSRASYISEIQKQPTAAALEDGRHLYPLIFFIP